MLSAITGIILLIMSVQEEEPVFGILLLVLSVLHLGKCAGC